MTQLLTVALDAAVPFQILELQRQGGPSKDDIEKAREFGSELASKADTLLYGGKKGEAGRLFNQTARAIAVLAFCPGGVTFAGSHYDGQRYMGNGELLG